MAIRALIAGAILFAGGATGALAASTSTGGPKTTTGMEFNCPIPRGFEAVGSNAELPTALARKYAGAAPIGRRWNDTDERSLGEPETGIEFVLHKGRRWIVGGLNAGIAVWLNIYAYDLRNDGTLSDVTTPPTIAGSSYCAAVAAAAVARGSHRP